MPKNLFLSTETSPFGTGQTVNAANGTYDFDIDLDRMPNLHLLVVVRYAVVASPTGCTLRILPGLGKDLASAKFATADTATTDAPALATVTGAGVDIHTLIYLSSTKYPRFIRLRFTNLDGTNNATVTLYGDSGL